MRRSIILALLLLSSSALATEPDGLDPYYEQDGKSKTAAVSRDISAIVKDGIASQNLTSLCPAPTKHPRILADVNGDGKADIVGFGDSGVLVALSTGSGFGKPEYWTSDFSYSAGWRVEKHVRTVADVNGDGKADIVGFGENGVIVALSTGFGFGEPEYWINNFAYSSGGWRVEKHVRTVADVNDDGKADIVGFGENGVIVALSTGFGFGQPKYWINNFAYSAGGWR